MNESGKSVIFKIYDRVKIVNGDFAESGAPIGSVGYIIEDYGESYEVEVSDVNGITVAMIVVKDVDIKADP